MPYDNWFYPSEAQKFCEGLGKSSYSKYEHLLREIWLNITSELNETYVHVVTDSDVAISDEVFLPVAEQHYEVEFNVTGNRLIHTRIRNSTFKNLHFYLSSKTVSISIEQNIFIGSGMIFTNLTEEVTEVIIQDNLFEGELLRPIFIFKNAKNIYLKGNFFENLQFKHVSSIEGELSTGINCDKSEIKLQDSVFKQIKLDTVLHLNNCSMEIKNVSVLENAPPIINTSFTVINMDNSKGNFSNVVFANNEESICFLVRRGELLFQNISISGNQLTSSDSMMNVIGSRIALIDIMVVNNTGLVMSTSDSTGNISSSTWKHNGGIKTSFSISDSQIEIKDSIFEENLEENLEDSDLNLLKISGSSMVIISETSFISNKVSLILLSGSQPLASSSPVLTIGQPSVDILTEPLLNISSCRFQDNIIHSMKYLLNAFNGVMKLTDTIFVNNTKLSDVGSIGTGIVQGSQAIISFDNCNVSNNYGEIPFLYLEFSLVNISDCLFVNNSASNYAGVIYIFLDNSLKIENTIFEQNSCTVEGGVILSSTENNVSVINSTFIENKSFGSDGGAILIGQRSAMVSENCIFIGKHSCHGKRVL